MLGNVAGARQVFERWMEWQPEEQSWHSYINFELRYKEVDRARSIYERYILLRLLLFQPNVLLFCCCFVHILSLGQMKAASFQPGYLRNVEIIGIWMLKEKGTNLPVFLTANFLCWGILFLL